MEQNASVLGRRLYELDRDTLAALGAALCAKLTERGSYHGGIRPENIFCEDPDHVELGECAKREAAGEWTPGELEYMAPEVFWNGTLTPAADVYSVGMLLYAGVTGGQMPFCPPDASAADRDEALRQRMNGDVPDMPKTAGKHLARIIEKSLQFRADDRYESPAALGEALTDYREILRTNIPAAREMFEKPRQELTEVERMLLDILTEKAEREKAERLAAEQAAAEEAARLEAERLAAEEAERAERERLEAEQRAAEEAAKAAAAAEAEAEPPAEPETEAPQAAEGEAPEAEPEQTELQKAGKKAGLDPALVEAISASVAARMAEPELPEDETKKPVIAERTEAHKAEEERISQQLEEMDWIGHNGNQKNDRRNGWIVALLCIVAIVLGALILHSIGDIGRMRQQMALEGSGDLTTETSQPVETAVPTPTPVPTETPEPTPTPVPHRYEVVLSNASWEAAKQEAEAKGGYLAVVESGEELGEITRMAAEKGAKYVWIGLSRTSTGELKWVKGTENGYISWAAGEPSVRDSYTGNSEDYVLVANQDGTWLYNDCIGDPAGSYPRFYSGVLGYVIEYDS